jgi:uncharacterized protein (TIGR03435 family)
MAPYLAEATIAQLPKWATRDSFEIDARAVGNPTKDQMRLMMQSLLAETVQTGGPFRNPGPVLALTLVKPGQTRPKLRRMPMGRPVEILRRPHPARRSMCFRRIAVRT